MQAGPIYCTPASGKARVAPLQSPTDKGVQISYPTSTPYLSPQAACLRVAGGERQEKRFHVQKIMVELPHT